MTERALCDRLAALGIPQAARALPLLEEARRRVSLDAPLLDAVLAAASSSPDPALYVLNFSKWCDGLPPGEIRDAFRRDGALPVLGALLGGSEILPEQIARRPGVFRFLFLEGGYGRRGDGAALRAEALAAADASATEEEIKRVLREIKAREVARIGARDLAGLSPLEEVTGDLSALASAALSGAVRFARRVLADRFGPPRVEGSGGECGFAVMGMGKLGAGELNFSSDIDLIYLYETDRGGTPGGSERRPLTLHEFFVRLSESVTRIVSEVTEDGFVFRVDLRLRPEGSRGDLANSLRSAEIYYESWGQTWERGALIKARPVAGDRAVGEEFLRIVTPFVYRKYLDFTAIEEIKEMKDRIDLESARARRGGRDLKLGGGGIREIEFFAQAHQLIYGGKDPSLRLRGTEETLSALAEGGVIPRGECSALTEAYRFLRMLEHRIQILRERQTHVLPAREDELRRLARTMGLSSPADLTAALDRHAGKVRAAFGRLFRGAGGERREEASPEALEILESSGEERDLPERLRRAGFRDPETAARNLAALREGPAHTRLSARARRYLGKIAPRILSRVLSAPDPDRALAHVDRFLSSIGARTMFYALLFENPKVIDVLVRLFGSSPFLAGYLLRHPELLDTFLRKDLSPLVKGKGEMRKEIGEILAACEDYEREMDEMRRYKSQETIRIGLHDLAGALSLEEGMHQHSALAEVLLGFALVLARRETSRRFGVPRVPGEGEEIREAQFCVLGMGKLGAEELSYHSDLDILFVYEGAGETAPLPGAGPEGFRRISNHEFFAKVAQRLISVLTTATREGYVYHLDTRLRPSGNAGPLVTSLASLESYHARSAALWERQALIKCRFVAGDREFGRRVEERMAEFAYGRPLPEGAAPEIHRLRRRMEVELGKERADRLNLKVGRGGIVDVEFAVQFLQLLHGAGNRSLRARPTLKALYELSRAGVLPAGEFAVLDEGYRFLRALEVRLRLSHDASIEQFDPKAIPAETAERYRAVTEGIRGAYLRILGIEG